MNISIFFSVSIKKKKKEGERDGGKEMLEVGFKYKYIYFSFFQRRSFIV
jgi:hypothetical protein